jgi:hypothetical protein
MYAEYNGISFNFRLQRENRLSARMKRKMRLACKRRSLQHAICLELRGTIARFLLPHHLLPRRQREEAPLRDRWPPVVPEEHT